MSPGEALMGIFGMAFTFGWIPMFIYFKHRYRIEELRTRAGGFSQESLAELRALRQEVERLRDTTTKFDVAFDNALTRLEERVDNVEGNPVKATVPPVLAQANTYTTEPAPQTMSVGRQQWM